MSERQPPNKIFLQWYGERVEPFDEGVTWCEDKINYDDIEYRRAEFADTAAEIAAKYIILTSNLLEACRVAVSYMEKTSANCDIYHAEMMNPIRAAIAKATAPDV